MSQTDQPQAVRSYLGELESALSHVPREVAREIVDGAAEELSGLDAEKAVARIEEMGDPQFIAAEAMAETGATTKEASGAISPPAAERRWYTVLASLLVAVGGVIVPILGWGFGIAMMWVSKSWRAWEKWVATFFASIVAVFVTLILYWVTGSGRGVDAGPGNGNQNQLVPADLLWNGVVLLVVLNGAVGLWLLWRALRRKPAV